MKRTRSSTTVRRTSTVTEGMDHQISSPSRRRSNTTSRSSTLVFGPGGNLGSGREELVRASTLDPQDLSCLPGAAGLSPTRADSKPSSANMPRRPPPRAGSKQLPSLGPATGNPVAADVAAPSPSSNEHRRRSASEMHEAATPTLLSASPGGGAKVLDAVSPQARVEALRARRRSQAATASRARYDSMEFSGISLYKSEIPEEIDQESSVPIRAAYESEAPEEAQASPGKSPRKSGHPASEAAGDLHSRMAQKLAAKGFSVPEIADTMDLDTNYVEALLRTSSKATTQYNSGTGPDEP